MKRIRFVPNQNLTGDLYCAQKPRIDVVKPKKMIKMRYWQLYTN